LLPENQTMENPQTKKSTGTATKVTMDEQILAVMMGFHMDGNHKVTLKDVATELGKQERTKSFRERWSILKNDKGYIGTSKISGKGFFELTQEGIEHAQTDEYKEMMKEMNIKSKTNSEHQERIKKRFKKPKSELIFDFLNEYGSLSSDDLAALVGQNKRSHSYHYSLKELREKGYAEEDPNHDGKEKKFRLTDNSFLKVEVDRVKDDAIDTGKLAEKITEGIAIIESRIRKNKERKSVKQELKVKDEESEEKGDDDDDDNLNHSTAASNTSSNNEDTVPDIANSSELSDGQQHQQQQKKRKKSKVEVRIEAAKNKETTSRKNNKRQRIKHDLVK
jgi:hypothetical protein